MQNLAFVRTYTFRMKSKESFINETPGAYLLLFSLKTSRTSSSLIFSAGLEEMGVAGGVNGCLERSSGRVWGVFSNLQ